MRQEHWLEANAAHVKLAQEFRRHTFGARRREHVHGFLGRPLRVRPLRLLQAVLLNIPYRRRTSLRCPRPVLVFGFIEALVDGDLVR